VSTVQLNGGSGSRTALGCSRPKAGLSQAAFLATPLQLNSYLTHDQLHTSLNTTNLHLTSPQHHPSQQQQSALVDHMTTDIQNLKSFDPFAEADDTGGESKTSQQNYIHIRIQRKHLPLLPQETATAHRVRSCRDLCCCRLAPG
jgi:hypothetical protein